jgi:hypothetical protein
MNNQSFSFFIKPEDYFFKGNLETINFNDKDSFYLFPGQKFTVSYSDPIKNTRDNFRFGVFIYKTILKEGLLLGIKKEGRIEDLIAPVERRLFLLPNSLGGLRRINKEKEKCGILAKYYSPIL